MVSLVSEEVRRREQAELLKERFLADLDKLCGRVPDSDDELTRRIYESAKTKGIDVASELGTDWVASCGELVLSFRRKIPNGPELFHRVVRVTKGLGNCDLDGRTALGWAQDYFSSSEPHEVDVLNLATCLLDTCFVRPEKVESTLELPMKADFFRPERALAVRDANAELELREWESQANLGKAIRVLATVLGSLAFLFTKAVVIIPMVLVAWVMAYTLIDYRSIKAQKERLALKPGEKPAE